MLRWEEVIVQRCFLNIRFFYIPVTVEYFTVDALTAVITSVQGGN